LNSSLSTFNLYFVLYYFDITSANNSEPLGASEKVALPFYAMLSWLTSRKLDDDASRSASMRRGSNTADGGSVTTTSSRSTGTERPSHVRRLATALTTPSRRVAKKSQRQRRRDQARVPGGDDGTGEMQAIFTQPHLNQQQQLHKLGDRTRVDETRSGIEILIGPKESALAVPDRSASPQAGPSWDDSARKAMGDTGVISLLTELTVKSRIHFAQLNVARWPVSSQLLEPEKPSVHEADSSLPTTGEADWKLRRHRVPLFVKKSNSGTNTLSSNDVLFLLRAHAVVDEKTSVQEEYQRLSTEIGELEYDRAELEQKCTRLSPFENVDDNKIRKEADTPQEEWDLHRVLQNTPTSKVSVPSQTARTSLVNPLTQGQREKVEEQRGLHWTIVLQSPAALEAMLVSLGSSVKKAKLANGVWTVSAPDPSQCLVPSIPPQNCGHGNASNASANISHISLWKAAHGEVSFFISRDCMPSTHEGPWPERLMRRITEGGVKFQGQQDIAYLTTGPRESYYVALRSGECWWGSLDPDLDAICTEWNVHRVAFGNSTGLVDAGGQVHLPNSWIVVDCDGRVAWKNISSRLHRILEERLADAAGVVEVSFGPGGAYFIRFLDQSYDYFLPAHIAQACQTLEQDGKDITNIVMHPELSQDFIIRSKHARAGSHR
jgi:hypothetical protein